MTDFFTAFDKNAKAALATPDGAEFADSNFSFSHTGGGCHAFQRDIDDTGWTVVITDSEGVGALIDPAIEGDFYMVGLQHDDGAFVNPTEEAKTAEDAIAIADRYHELVAAGDFSQFKVE